jgi:hypothetical protein
MSRKWEGRLGVVLAALVAGGFALILLISVGSPAVAGSGSGGSAGSGSSGSGSSGSGSSGSSISVADFALTANYKSPSFVGHVADSHEAYRAT